MSEPIPFPDFDPVALQIGPFAIRWYALAYISGLLLGWAYIAWLMRRPPKVMSRDDLGDFLTWAVVGVIVGGRLGYVTMYKPAYFLFHPLETLFVWQGGMSFHGGLLGVAVAIVLFARRRELARLPVADLIACAAPIGLLLGRIANFINGELFGRPTDAPWAVVFPGGGAQGRHPSQLYEAALEGLVLFALLFALARFTRARGQPGLLTGVFLAGYGTARMAVEIFRQPDAHLGFLALGTTMGQLLSIPLVLAGLYLIWRALRAPADMKGRPS